MNATHGEEMQLVARFCGQCSCGCPELHIDHSASPERRVVITDDFGQRVQMSREQAAHLVAWARSDGADGLASG